MDIIRYFCGFERGNQHNYRIGMQIFGPMGNRQRSDLLKGLTDEIFPTGPWRETLNVFRKQFDICLVNRNLVAHSIYVDEISGPLIVAQKFSPHMQEKYIPSETSFWVKILSEIHNLYEFGENILDAKPLESSDFFIEIPPTPVNLAATFENFSYD